MVKERMEDYSSLLSQKPDYLVCTCMGVMYSDIVAAIAQGNTTFEALQETLLVGTGCSSCHEEVQQILKEQAR
jgi:NAD(P)H-nitrite reductase large subunit